MNGNITRVFAAEFSRRPNLKKRPERYLDLSFVKELDGSGFIDKPSHEYKVK